MAATERRRAARRVPGTDEPIAQVRLRAGRELLVLDVSNGGALVEGVARLLPGTHVDVHVITPAGRLLVRSRVVRAYVSVVAADSVTYRGALFFERGIETHGYVIPASSGGAARSEGNDYPPTSASLVATGKEAAPA